MTKNNLKETKESPYVHVFTAYLQSLKNHWAYEGTNRLPGRAGEKFICHK